MNLRIIRDVGKFLISLVLFWLYLPHIFLYFVCKNKYLIQEDIKKLSSKVNINLSTFPALIFFLHSSSYFRTLFYHRIGPINGLLIGWWRPGCKYFIISKTTKIDGGVRFAHPYSTIINAESIGKNFSVKHLTTIGNKRSNRPIIGDNVALGAGVTIIGRIKIGNNVVIGAGSVVIKDIPDESVYAGNPARFIKKI